MQTNKIIMARLACGYDQYKTVIAIAANYKELSEEDGSISDLVGRITEGRRILIA